MKFSWNANFGNSDSPCVQLFSTTRGPGAKQVQLNFQFEKNTSGGLTYSTVTGGTNTAVRSKVLREQILKRKGDYVRWWGR